MPTDGGQPFLGYDDPNNELTINFTPATVISVDGSGIIVIDIPQWYDVTGRQSMMFDPFRTEDARVSSPQMTIEEAEANFITKKVNIRYSNMPSQFRDGV